MQRITPRSRQLKVPRFELGWYRNNQKNSRRLIRGSVIGSRFELNDWIILTDDHIQHGFGNHFTRESNYDRGLIATRRKLSEKFPILVDRQRMSRFRIQCIHGIDALQLNLQYGTGVSPSRQLADTPLPDVKEER